MEFDLKAAKEKLNKIHQNHLLDQWDQLSAVSQAKLLHQLQAIDIKTFTTQKDLLLNPLREIGAIDPYQDYVEINSTLEQEYADIAFQQISQGHVGCILLAGGQGTRLNFNGPKGMFPVTPIKHKTLFQLCAEKVLAASQLMGLELPLAIMTSPLNDAQTKQYFKDNNFFGLNPYQVSFFSQGMLPLLNQEHKLFLTSQSELACGPDGNGSVFQHFYQSGIWEQWHAAGIQMVNIILIDNILADPFDFNLIGFHKQQCVQVSIKATARQNPLEHVGIIAKKEDNVQVIEYTELSNDEAEAKNIEGKLKHYCANLSLFCMSMDFLKHAADQAKRMPLHLALKKIENSSAMSWKYEKFIFDILPFAETVGVLLCPREACFAPLKNASGMDSLEYVQKALYAYNAMLLEKMTGKKIPEHCQIELAPEFYYPTDELLAHWRGKSITESGYLTGF